MKNRYDFVYLFEVKDGNPNGDPDAGNLPRTDPETGHGLVTDVCLKRKVRNFVEMVHDSDNPAPFEIYVKERAVLNNQHERAYEAKGIKAKDVKGKDKQAKDKQAKVNECRQWMCDQFYDIRTFGAVMTTGVNCGQVRGPIQFGFARSVDPVMMLEHSLTRCAVTTEKEAEKQGGDNRTMGRKFTIPYGLYRVHGFVNPHLARSTGFDQNSEDLDLFWKSLEQMFDFDRSAARGEMTPRELVIFKHESALGNAPAHRLFERVSVKRKDDQSPARDYTDYEVKIDESGLPEGISVIRPFEAERS